MNQVPGYEKFRDAARHAAEAVKADPRRLKIFAGLGAAAILAAGYFLFFAGGGDEGGGMRGGAPTVGTQAVGHDEFMDVIEALGTAAANESIVITAKVTETVRKINFADGQQVKAGDILVELKSDEDSGNLDAARAELEQAEKQFERMEGLVGKGSVSQAQFDAQRAARDAARGKVAAIEARLADRLIRAPFDGVLGLRAVSLGALVKPGDTITTLDDISVVKVDFTVPERFLAALKPGMEIFARASAYPGEQFNGKVVMVDSRVDPATRSVVVRAEVPNPERKLRPGMLMTVDLVRERRTAIAVPEAAIVPVGEQRFVFRLDAEGKVERVEVETGLRKPGMVEIVSGLKEGDVIVTEGTLKVRPGVKVNVAPPAEAPTASTGGGAT